MRVFIVGASGSIGERLVPRLIRRGHEVLGTARSAGKAERVRVLGAKPLVLDLLDAAAVRQAVLSARPDAIVHEATALAGVHDFRHFDRSFAATNLLRTRGTDVLIEAAREAGVSRLVAQSYAGWPYARQGSPIKAEDDALDERPAASMRETQAAIEHLERTVLGAGGIALRYGSLYGAPDDPMLDLVRKRLMPIVGDGGGIWSLVHLDDATEATVLAVERGAPGVYNIVDDDPAPVRDWLPALAAAIGAPSPRHVPRWLARLLAGEAPVRMMTEIRGASNAKAKRQLGWTLRHSSWRLGFVESYALPRPRAQGASGPRPVM
jgi:2-alkyl-3-oxoalkanoate reductase